MSDSDSGDDGGIDKEALREELREKYEQDERERETTQRMSDLLLKGATMTNSHCGACGGPFFRQNGTTFCPTCHGGPEGVEGRIDEADDAANVTDDETAAAGAEPDRETSDASDGSTATGDVGESGTESTDAHTFQQADSPATPNATREPTEPDTGASVAPERDDRAGTDRRRPDRGHVSGADGTPGRGAGSDGTPGRAPTGSRQVDGDLSGAHDSLVTALERFSREAAATDDPRHARECLEAAHEAARTLQTLRE